MSICIKRLDVWAEEIPAIGIVGEKVGPVIRKNGLRNFTGSYLYANSLGHEAFLGTPVFFWDEPEEHTV